MQNWNFTVRRAALALVLTFAVGACGAKPTPTSETATLAPAASGARLSVMQPTVQFRERETDNPRDLQSGDVIDVMPGANMIVRGSGRAQLTWTDFLTHEMLADTDTLLSLSQPDQRYVVLDQATGTARYTLAGAGQKANLQVKAGAIVDLQVDAGEADFIISLVPSVVSAKAGEPSSEPAAWLVVLKGSAKVAKSGLGPAAGAITDTTGTGTGADQSVTVGAGQAAAFTKSGDLPQPLDIDASTVQAWYNDVAQGTAKVSIVSVAYRCAVTADQANFLAAADPKAKPAGSPLPKGTLINIIQRDAAGNWLRGIPLAGTDKGWVAVKDLACLGPIAQVPTTAPGEAGAVPSPTVLMPTRVPPALGTVTRTPTLSAATATRTPTAGPLEIDFGASPREVNEGGCSTLHWSVTNVREVYLDEQGVAGQGEKRVCPTTDTSYTLRVVSQDGSERSDSVTVKVHKSQAPTNTPAPAQPTDTNPPPEQPTLPLPTSPPPTSPPDTPVPADTPVPPADTPVPPATP